MYCYGRGHHNHQRHTRKQWKESVSGWWCGVGWYDPHSQVNCHSSGGGHSNNGFVRRKVTGKSKITGKSPENPRSPESHRKIQGRHRKTQDHRQLSIHGSPWSNNVACRDGLKVQTPPTDADVMFPLRLGVPDCWMGRLARWCIPQGNVDDGWSAQAAVAPWPIAR